MNRITRILTAASIATGIAAGSIVATAPVAGADVTPAQAQEFLDTHNEVRRNTAQAETARLGRQVTIPDLTWSDDLARAAQAWAENQAAINQWDHDPNLGGVGENLAVGRDTPRGVVQRWASEVADYDYETNSCTPGEACGHYTQIVWANTTTVGCGIAEHPGWGEIHVCRYGPGGNFRGERPYEPGGPVTNPQPPRPPVTTPQPPVTTPPVVTSPDSFATPRVLNGMAGTVTGDSTGATLEAGEPRVDGVGRASVHHSIVAPVSGTLVVSTAGSTFDTAVGVGTGASAAGLTFLGQNDDANDTLQSEVTVNVTQGQEIRIVVDGYQGATGAYTLNWTFNG